jgi:hypothetical protein
VGEERLYRFFVTGLREIRIRYIIASHADCIWSVKSKGTILDCEQAFKAKETRDFLLEAP